MTRSKPTSPSKIDSVDDEWDFPVTDREMEESWEREGPKLPPLSPADRLKRSPKQTYNDGKGNIYIISNLKKELE